MLASGCGPGAADTPSGHGQALTLTTRSQTAAVDHQEPLGASLPPHLKKVVEVHQMIAEGDTIACRSTMTGTHLGWLDIGPLAGIERQGARVEVSHMHSSATAVTGWPTSGTWDTTALLRQLGAPLPEMRVG
ncbi:MAG TPA: hypothetical protein VGQ45_00990 [Gaiellales bacterium]|nr:hypothetical protein [Gaiellales bacterium]